jgi:ABC-type lipoprotein release transport system permease subunit
LNPFLFIYAGKNIWRHKGRSFFIAFSVSLAVTLSVWVMAFFDGMNYQIEQAVVNTNLGDYQIQETHYSFNTDSGHPLEWNESLEKKIKKAGASAYSPELILDANISAPEGSASLSVIGIISDLHRNFLPIADSLSAGEFIENIDTDSVVIGEALAQEFKYHVGDEFVLNYQDINGELRSEILKIKGIYQFNANVFQKRYVYISQRTWQNLYFDSEDGFKFNRIAIRLNSQEQNLKKKFPEFKIKHWKDLNPEMAVVLDFHDGMVRLFFLIIAVTIMMTILTPVRMLWQERLKEFRMLHILGVNFNNFWSIGISEVVLMILLSSVLSTTFLTIVLGIQSQTGLDFNFINQGYIIERAGIRLPRIVYPRLAAEQILITVTMVILILGSSYSWSISRTLKKLKEEQ